jgi:hypothetical protein
MLELPISDKQCYAERDKDKPVKNPHYEFPRDYQFEQEVRKLVEEDKYHAFVLQAMCDSLAMAGTQVIAAAGNDWENADGQKDAPRRLEWE